MGVFGDDEEGGEAELFAGEWARKREGGVRLTDEMQTLKMIRHMLDQSNYSQVPQLSSGLDIDLDDMGLVL